LILVLNFFVHNRSYDGRSEVRISLRPDNHAAFTLHYHYYDGII